MKKKAAKAAGREELTGFAWAVVDVCARAEGFDSLRHSDWTVDLAPVLDTWAPKFAVHAAAPDLLAALEQLTGWLERHQEGGGETPPDDVMDEARAAIAKARRIQTTPHPTSEKPE